MKKSIFLFAIALTLNVAFCTSVKAQDSQPVQMGLKGGANFCDLYTNDADKSEMMPGFHAGLFSKLHIAGPFSFQPEFYFTTKGAEVTYNNTFVSGVVRYKLNYLELPLLIAINITPEFNIHFGPYASYLLNGKVKNKSTAEVFDFEDNIDVNDYYRIDAGIAGGAGIDYRAVSFGLRFSYGLVKVGRERNFMGTTYTFPDGNNGVVSLYMAVPLRRY